MERNFLDNPHNSLPSDYEATEHLTQVRTMTDSEALMAIIVPEKVFSGFERFKEAEELLSKTGLGGDSWQRQWRRRSANHQGRTEINGEKYSTSIVISEPGFIGRVVKRLRGQQPASVHITRASYPVNTR